VTGAIAAICATNPKACFGSCPTFYAPDSSGGEVLAAEGFSASIAPALEATDVDMLYFARPKGKDLTLRLTNEALETHFIRYADVLAVPKPPSGHVFVTPDGVFRETTEITEPAHCQAAEGDCRQAVLAYDHHERWSSADSTDLATREVIDLDFDRIPDGELGVVVTSRQTLMTTYLIYQALAYLGSAATHVLATIEKDGAEGFSKLLGQIEVLVPDGAGGWTVQGSTGETGPIAADTKVIPIPRVNHVRLRLTRGLWRIDWVALAQLGAVANPVRIAASGVKFPLTTLPGDSYQLHYQVPEGSEIFLESRGYYLEWMRQSWMAEENPIMAARLALDPAGLLKEVAPVYHRQEATADRLFWQSRYATHR
jgi:hypothetical protein